MTEGLNRTELLLIPYSTRLPARNIFKNVNHTHTQNRIAMGFSNPTIRYTPTQNYNSKGYMYSMFIAALFKTAKTHMKAS